MTARGAGGVLCDVSVVLHLVIVTATLLVFGSVVPSLVLEIGAARSRRRADTCGHDEDEPLHWAVRLRGRLDEAALTLFALVLAPFTLGRRDARISQGVADRPPLVLLLGWGQHPRLWRTLARRLATDGWGRLAVAGWTTPRLSLDHGADVLGEAIARLRGASGGARVDVVAHGAAGLAVRAYLRRAGADAGIGRVLTLGTPHQGTEVGTWPVVRTFAGALAPGGDALAALVAHDPAPDLVDFVALYSHEDAIVLPPALAYYPGAFGIEVRGPGHLGLLRSWHVYELIRENLAAESAPVKVAHAGTRHRDG